MEVSEMQDPSLERDAATLDAINLEMSWASHRRMEQDLAAFNLTAPQYMALRNIASRPESYTMTALASSSLQVSATMTGIVERLLERGLVTRDRDPQDRRTLRVGLTPAGRDLLEQVNSQIRASTIRLLSSFSIEERGIVIAGLRCYLRALEASLDVEKNR